ncbi:DHA2 family efflux MFS transporter permease subunit [Actinoplanes palleronii]
MSGSVPDHRWLILATIAAAQLMVVLDATVVNIALPSAQADLGFADSGRQWIVTAYALAFGALLLLGGRVGDIIGRKRIFLVSALIFALASLAGGAAPTFTVLVVARAVQGIAAAALAPATLATLVSTFRDPRERGQAFAVYGIVSVVGAAVGLIIGGFLTQYLSWRFALYINVVFAIPAFIGALAYLRREHPPKRQPLDLAGACTVALGLVGIVLGFSQAGSAGWSAPSTLVSLTLGVIFLAVFVLVERRTAHPLLPLHVITDRMRATSFGVLALVGVQMFAVFLFLSYYLQGVKGFSASTSGLAFLPFIACIMISANLVGTRFLPRFGPRIVLPAGMLLGVIAMLILSTLTPTTPYAAGVLPGLIAMGLALGAVMAPATNAATIGVAVADSGVASALVNTMQQVGGSIGVAVLSTVAASVTASRSRSGHEHLSASNLLADAATHGYVAVFLLSGGLFLLTGIVCATLFPDKTEYQRREANLDT